jgi:hypothetical protein
MYILCSKKIGNQKIKSPHSADSRINLNASIDDSLTLFLKTGPYVFIFDLVSLFECSKLTKYLKVSKLYIIYALQAHA